MNLNLLLIVSSNHKSIFELLEFTEGLCLLRITYNSGAIVSQVYLESGQELDIPVDTLMTSHTNRN